MIKRIHILFTALVVVTLCHAQLLPTDKSRYGTIDPQKAEELYKEVFAANSPIFDESKPVTMDFYVKFKRMKDLAPYVRHNLYGGVFYEGPKTIYRRMLDSIADPAIKVMLVDDAIECGRMFVDHFDSINVLREISGLEAMPLPLAKIKSAHYNYMFAHESKYYPAHLYDKEKAYELYREAFKAFLAAKDTSNQQNNKELEAFYVGEYYKVCEDLYKTNEEKYYEQFLKDYQEIVQVCDKLLIPCYDDPDSLKEYSDEEKYKLYRNYRGAVYGVNEGDTVGVKLLFANSGAGTADKLKAYYAPRLEHNKGNKEFLDKAINFMYENNFTNDSVFFDYCQASYNLGETFQNCIGLASSANDKEKMRAYYEKALEISTDTIQKAQIRYLIASSMFTVMPKPANMKNSEFMKTPEYEQWQDELRICNGNLEAMLKNKDLLLKDSRLDVRDYVAQAYYMRAENNYYAAVQYLNTDLIKDAYNNLRLAAQYKLRASTINNRKVNIDVEVERFKTLEEAIKNAKAKARANAKLLAEYEEYIRKKKQEEEFWNQK